MLVMNRDIIGAKVTSVDASPTTRRLSTDIWRE
jgi:hypothetical protein